MSAHVCSLHWSRRGWRSHAHRLQHLSSFFNDVEVVGGEVLQHISNTGRPDDFNEIGFRGAIEPKVNAHVILREVAATAADLLHLFQWLLADTGLLLRRCCRAHRNACAYSSTITLLTHQPQFDPVAAYRGVTTQKLRRRVHAVHHDVHVAIIVVITKCAATCRGCFGHPRTCDIRY